MTALNQDRGGDESAIEQDQALLEAVSRGDMQSFELLTRAYHGRLHRFLLRLVNRADLADEALNDTLFAIWNGASRFRRESCPSTWIFGIAYHKGLKALQRSRRWWQRHQPMDDLEWDPDDRDTPGIREELSEWLELALTGLPPQQRAVIELTYFLDRSYEEIAQIMDCPIGTVKTRMYHARRRLRPVLERLARPSTAEA